MVEGPGCTRNGRKVQLAVGKALIDSPSAAAPTLPRHIIIDGGELTANRSRLLEAFTVGKELFLIFAAANTDDDVALRLHFGMNGSLNARKVKASDLQKPPSGIAPWKQGKEPSLRLYFVEDIRDGHSPGSTSYIVIEAWDTTVNYPVSASKSRNKMIELTSRDVCSSLFNAQNVFTAIRELGNNMIISDALLNQDICPGVGNIIKIESLHRSMIDPRRIVNSLTDPELRRVIKIARI
jgi:endonuclease VIII-like 3